MEKYEVIDGTVYINDTEYKKGEIIKEKLEKDDIDRLEKQGFIKEYVIKTAKYEKSEEVENPKKDLQSTLSKMKKIELVEYCKINNIEINEEDLRKYNVINELSLGDKLIIPNEKN